MLRDASHRQTIQKFSFIQSLNLSRAQDRQSRKVFRQPNPDLAIEFELQNTETRSSAAKTQTEASSTAGALATTSQTATIDTNWYQQSNDYSLSLAEIIRSTTDNVEPQVNLQSPAKFSNSGLGKILFALACSYCLFAVWWVFGSEGKSLLTHITGGKRVVLEKSEIEFIDYLERSLNRIEREVAARRKSNDEVVYIPVYTPTTTSPQVASNNLPLSTLPSINSTSIPAPPLPLPIPAPPPLPSPTPMAANSSDNAIVASKPKINRTLIGVLDLGAGRSAALIKMQGKTRRIWIGEEISADGWILESVGNQRAKISSSGQVRSISVGETF